MRDIGLHGSFEYEAIWKTPAPGTLPDPAVVGKALHDQLGLQLQAKPVTVDVIEFCPVTVLRWGRMVH